VTKSKTELGLTASAGSPDKAGATECGRRKKEGAAETQTQAEQASKPRSARGDGCLFRPKYRDRKTGEVRESPHWWMKYSRNGQSFRENTKKTVKTAAARVLRARLAEIDRGEADPRAREVDFSELAEDLRTEYKSNGRRLDRLETSLARLLPVFGNVPVTRIGGDRIENYKAKRKAEGVSNATIDRELTALRRALNLGKRHRKVACVPPIDVKAK